MHYLKGNRYKKFCWLPPSSPRERPMCPDISDLADPSITFWISPCEHVNYDHYQIYMSMLLEVIVFAIYQDFIGSGLSLIVTLNIK